MVVAYGYWDVPFFAKFFLPHHCILPFSPMHLAMLEKDPTARGWTKVFAAPRGSAKTTTCCLIDCIHDACYNLEDFILILSETATVANDRVRDIKSELETNETILEYFGEFAGDKWTETDITTRDSVRITSKGRGGQVRGLLRDAKRPTKVIIDDVETRESVQSPIQRAKVWEWLNRDVKRVGNERTNFKIIGTFLHQEAALPRLTQVPAYKSQIYKAVISWAEREDLWAEWRERYIDLTDINRERTAREFYLKNQAEMDRGVEVLWEDKPDLSYYAVQEAIINQGRYAVTR